jgi:uncharacterized protein (TIGR02611 family)
VPLLRWINEQREKRVMSRAGAFLHDGEDVVDWVRIKHPGGSREGVMYLTSERLVAHWSGRPDDDAITWRAVRTWGIDQAADGGPILGVESQESSVRVQMPVGSRSVARTVTGFIRRFGHLAPNPRGELSDNSAPVRYSARTDVEITKQRRTWAGHTKRILVTVIGTVLVLVGLAMLALPGPGILVTIAGLAVLSSEYEWAKDLLDWAREKYRNTKQRVKSSRAPSD